MNKNTSYIYLYAANPGALSVLIPVYQYLKEKSERPVWVIENIDYQSDDFIYYQQFEDMFKTEKDLKNKPILIGAQVNTSRTHQIIDQCNTSGMKTFFITDHWKNDHKQFFGGQKVFLPLIIFCIDDYMKNKFINFGIPEHKLEIVGHPSLERTSKTIFSKSDIKTIRNNLNIDKTRMLVSVFLDPVHDDLNNNYGYDEYDVLTFIFDVFSKKNLPEICLIIKVHPRQCKEDILQFVQQHKTIHCIVDQKSDPIELIMVSDKVMGMTSIALMHAIILNKECCSIQINRTQAGIERSDIYLEQLLVEHHDQLYDFICNPQKRLAINFETNSCQKIYDSIRKNK